jgi:hypothetical protein
MVWTFHFDIHLNIEALARLENFFARRNKNKFETL